MEYLLTAKEMKEMEEMTINQVGIPSMVLMERAALSVFQEIKKRRGSLLKEDKVLILCGGGNNGGDGLALGRMLSHECSFVEVIFCKEEEQGTKEFKEQQKILSSYPVKTGGIPTDLEYTVLIDALFGIGLNREITGEYADYIHWFNRKKGYKIAIDIPSGIHADSGNVMGCAIKAQLTIALSYGKMGLYVYPGCDYAGEIIVKDIGIVKAHKQESSFSMFRYTERAAELLPLRNESGNKGDFGKVLVIAGSENMAGAAVLAAKAAYRIGAGMVKVISKACNGDIIQTAVPEALFGTEEDFVESLKWAKVVVVGPGLSTKPETLWILTTLLEQCDLPLVIDADGLNVLAKEPLLQDIVSKQGAEGRVIILTPHMGELSRLTRLPMEQLKEQHIKSACDLAKELNCILVSKDARTIICQESKPICINITGNSGMATAGSGDVLSGMIAGLLSQNMESFQAASVAVYLHGLAGDYMAKEKGQWGLMALDIVDGIGR
ncbi:NAD(P)H-hydrate dehydratase [Lachnospiraceae bacterium OttesenSCG-928-D06]|nr:NAD(P)H-hydrate dehydratase [Lachnospiraceae bacterium OttesenSCG-928-D06]